MQTIHHSYSGELNRASLLNTLKGRSNLIFIAETTSGAIVGGFTGSAVIPTNETSTWLSASNMFVFNLNTLSKWDTSYSTSNIYVDTRPDAVNLIDFGWHNALQFEIFNNSATVSYSESGDFISDPTSSDMRINTSGFTVAELRVIQIYY